MSVLTAVNAPFLEYAEVVLSRGGLLGAAQSFTWCSLTQKDRLTKPELLGIIARPLFVEWLQFEHWVPELGTTMLEAYSREAIGLDGAIRQLLRQMAETQEYGLWRVTAIMPGGIELGNTESDRHVQIYGPGLGRGMYVGDEVYARLARQGEHWEIVSIDSPTTAPAGSVGVHAMRRRKGPTSIKDSGVYFLAMQEYVEASRRRKTASRIRTNAGR